MARCGSALVLWWLVIGCTFIAVSGEQTAKAFFCRDPDTGKFHPLNSTWYSSSFCGKYTCKLRRKGEDNPPTHPALVGNATKNSITQCSQSTAKVSEVESRDKGNKIIEDNVLNNVLVNQTKEEEIAKNTDLTASSIDGDRYLTDEEIKALAMILQYVKKSDLEAILDVYHLAQDIYKDLDNLDVNVLPNMTVEEKSKENKTIIDETPKTSKQSYWYDPLAVAASNKIKEAAEVIEVKPIQVPVSDIINSTNLRNEKYILNITQNLKGTEKVSQNSPISKMEKQKFFEGPMARNYLRILPYYHPLTDFQKTSSYVRPTEAVEKLETIAQPSNLSPPVIYFQAVNYPLAYIQQPMPSINLSKIKPNHRMHQQIQAEQQEKNYTNDQKAVKSENKQKHGKCCKQEKQSKVGPWSELPKKNNAIALDDKFLSNTNNTNATKETLSIGELKLMAAHDKDIFPYAYLQNDSVSSPYKREHIWSMLNLDRQLQKPLTRGPYVGHTVLVESLDSSGVAEVKETEQIQNVDDSTVIHDLLISNEMPEWQTAPLSAQSLNEAKANIAKSKFLPYPFRKKITLERIGKPNKVEERRRSKREAIIENENLNELYEVYIENSTCHTDTEPGFFRMGNASQLYPGCCPQRIPS
ncbi:hypothetical protein O0L34_g1839 [Tuta absoluta]|nr:hypothetical protein O0L34_g1839 [Tuta absoluta]